MRQQLIRLLHENNFVDTQNPNDQRINHNSQNINLVKAVITAGLYPNVGRLLKHKGGHFIRITLPEKQKGAFHPSSVNDKQKYFDEDWIIYWEKLKTTKVIKFVH